MLPSSVVPQRILALTVLLSSRVVPGAPAENLQFADLEYAAFPVTSAQHRSSAVDNVLNARLHRVCSDCLPGEVNEQPCQSWCSVHGYCGRSEAFREGGYNCGDFWKHAVQRWFDPTTYTYFAEFETCWIRPERLLRAMADAAAACSAPWCTQRKKVNTPSSGALGTGFSPTAPARCLWVMLAGDSLVRRLYLRLVTIMNSSAHTLTAYDAVKLNLPPAGRTLEEFQQTCNGLLTPNHPMGSWCDSR